MKRKNGGLLIFLGILVIAIGVFLLLTKKTVNKEYFIETAKQMINKVKENNENVKYGTIDPYTMYFIPESLIDYENKDINFKNAYIVITYNEVDFNYFFIGVDNNGFGIRYLTKLEDLKPELIKDIGKLGNLNKLIYDGFMIQKIYSDTGEFIDFDYVDEDMKDVPKIDYCEECVYKFTEDSIVPGDKLTNYKYDYREVKRDVFLGFSLDYDDKVELIYACGIVNEGKENEKVFCLEGPTDEYLADNVTNYLSTLAPYFDYCNEGLATYKDKGLYCYKKNDIGALIDRKQQTAGFEKYTQSHVITTSKDERVECLVYGQSESKIEYHAHCSVLR